MGERSQVSTNNNAKWYISKTPSQAALLLRKQLAELNKNPVEGFSAGLIDDEDIFRWEVGIISSLFFSLVQINLRLNVLVKFYYWLSVSWKKWAYNGH